MAFATPLTTALMPFQMPETALDNADRILETSLFRAVKSPVTKSQITNTTPSTSSFDVVPDVRKNLFDAVKGGRHTAADGAPYRLQVAGDSGNNTADNGLNCAPTAEKTA